MKPTIIKILIVEDHELVREGLRKILSLEKDFKIVGEAGTGAEAIRLARQIMPDVILLDINLPDMTGHKVCSAVKSDDALGGTNIIMLSMLDDEEHVMEAVRAGCSGYLVKSSPAEALIKSVRLVQNGEVVLPRELTAKLVSAVHKNQPRILSPKETEVIKLIAQGLSNKAIAKKLLSSASTVKNQISSIFTKLKVQSRSAAVNEASKKGLI